MFEKFKSGISIRRIHVWLIVILAFVSVTVVFSTIRLTRTFYRIESAYRKNIDLQKAARELMDASDYLTEQVQRFTISGDMRFLEQYFTEAFESNRREDAISKMNAGPETQAALMHLQDAMDNSVALMNQEYYAMRLVIDAKGYTDYPDILDSVTLSPEDATLSPEDKINRATELVLNDDYYELKDKIREGMRESLAEIDKLAKTKEDAESDSLEREINIVRTVIILQVILTLIMLYMTSHLGINPIIMAADRIRDDSPIREVGSKEFRYLAQAYNKMYSKNKSSIEHLNYQVSHDELTGVYNRAGYDFLLSNIDIKNAYMMLFDIDNFKGINDNYGHDAGDRALIKVARVLGSVFRDDDCICRIGGDEFVVFMVHASGMSERTIESKLNQISEELSNTDDGLPQITISVGIVNGKDVTDTATMFEKSDEAMYESKKQGKNTYTFYSAK
ncbi:MAG: GGDEF domain-containing protein [Lachnospiraceae bacterium]|nr:GGDEF domain-containing protein [Lachnospiraceae bacterium]